MRTGARATRSPTSRSPAPCGASVGGWNAAFAQRSMMCGAPWTAGAGNEFSRAHPGPHVRAHTWWPSATPCGSSVENLTTERSGGPRTDANGPRSQWRAFRARTHSMSSSTAMRYGSLVTVCGKAPRTMYGLPRMAGRGLRSPRTPSGKLERMPASRCWTIACGSWAEPGIVTCGAPPMAVVGIELR